MSVRSRTVAVVAAASLLIAAPVQAQDGASTVVFDDIGFTFERSLGASVNTTQVPGQSPDVQQPGEPDPPHIAFTLYSKKAEQKQPPAPANGSTVVRVYATADLADYPDASQELEALTSLLADGANLSPSSTGDATLPFLPVSPAPQVLYARAQIIDAPALTSVAYVTAFSFDAAPFAADDFTYTFQGLSADGDWYVSVDANVTVSDFPAKITNKETKAVDNNKKYAAYLEETVQALNDAAPDAFTPPLTAIDDLVQSITLPIPPEPEPSPEPTPEPTAEPSVAPPASADPTAEPSVAPTGEPSVAPTAAPTAAPSVSPLAEPSVAPSAAASEPAG